MTLHTLPRMYKEVPVTTMENGMQKVLAMSERGLCHDNDNDPALRCKYVRGV